MSSLLVAPIALLAVFTMMLMELRVSLRNERKLREAGAVEPHGDVHATMRWAYPSAFLAMGIEGALSGQAARMTVLLGAILLVASKALKFWAIASLGPRWTFRVLVMPGAPLVVHGPYALVRHPNYIAVVGEMIGMAVLVGAPVSGPVVTLLFGLLLKRRLQVENSALRHLACSGTSG